MFIFDPWKNPIPTELKTPIERIRFLHEKNNNENHIQIRGPIVPNTKSKRDTWTFEIDFSSYQKLFPEIKQPKFYLASIKRVKQNEARGRWPSLEISSYEQPLWNPQLKSWTLPQFCSHIDFITAHEPYRGKDLVAWAMQINYWLGFQMTTLLDRSHLSCENSPNGEIDLALMRTTTKGKTFYESLGFSLAPEQPFNPIADPTKQLHDAWESLKKECTWESLQKTWIQGNELIQKFQKIIAKGNEIPTLYMFFWDDSKNIIDTPKEWNTFMKYWLDWGYALSSLKKLYPLTLSPFDIYPTLEKIPEDKCGTLYNWFLILYQVFILTNKRTYNEIPIYLQLDSQIVQIPGAIYAQKWYILQRTNRTNPYINWVAPVSQQQLHN